MDLEELRKILLAEEAAGNISQQELSVATEVLEGRDTLIIPREFLKSDGSSQEEASSSTERLEYLNPTSAMSLSIPQKIKLALYGDATARTILIRDTNRLISYFVLKNPRLQLSEVEEFVKNPNISDSVLRTIGGQAAWVKSYAVKYGLVTNPKTPVDIAVKWLKYLNATDVKKISKSKNVANVVSTAARRLSADL